VGDILNFNPDRKINFDQDRELEFQPGRPLQFDMGRQLEFNANRDLGFGHRGIVFRGYVCPICGALVAEDSRQCDECGTVFDREPRAAGPSAPQPKVPASPAPPRSGEGGPKATPPVASPPKDAGAPLRSAYCAYCGVKLHAGDAFCWNCGARATGTMEVVKLPSQKSEPVMRDWR